MLYNGPKQKHVIHSDDLRFVNNVNIVELLGICIHFASQIVSDYFAFIFTCYLQIVTCITIEGRRLLVYPIHFPIINMLSY